MEEEAEKLKEMQGEVEKQLMGSKPGLYNFSFFFSSDVPSFTIPSLPYSNTRECISNAGGKNGLRQQISACWKRQFNVFIVFNHH